MLAKIKNNQKENTLDYKYIYTYICVCISKNRKQILKIF